MTGLLLAQGIPGVDNGIDKALLCSLQGRRRLKSRKQEAQGDIGDKQSHGCDTQNVKFC
jgi:hypothetical protein